MVIFTYEVFIKEVVAADKVNKLAKPQRRQAFNYGFQLQCVLGMALDIPLLNERKEIESLVREKQEAEGTLAAAGGNGYKFLLEDCSDLADIIDGISEISAKKSEKQHAAFETKVKFSRKIRRKAKDLKNFEQKLIWDYDNKRISLENGRKMVEIIKL